MGKQACIVVPPGDNTGSTVRLSACSWQCCL